MISIENYMPLAKSLAIAAKKKLPSNYDLDDLTSVAYLGLVEAANRFSEDKQTQFSTFAYLRIQGSILDFLRKEKYNNNVDLTNEPFYQDKFESSLFDKIETELGSRAAKVIRLRFVDEYSMKEIGKEIGIAESRVSQLLSEYVIQIRSSFSKDDLLEAA
jgi:RNA polymerase sigma factor (sigma-70 family)